MKSTSKKVFAFTLGDLGGIGPEIYTKFIEQNKQKLLIENNIEIVLLDYLADPILSQSVLNNPLSFTDLAKPSIRAGLHSLKVLQLACQLAAKNKLDYLITGPVSKESFKLAGSDFSGQTEALAYFSGLNSEDVDMFFVYDDLITVLATRHIPVSQVSQKYLKVFKKKIQNIVKAQENIFKFKQCQVEIAGLNPHASENGLIGDEDIYITKFIQEIQCLYPNTILSKPKPADSLFAGIVKSAINRASIKKTNSSALTNNIDKIYLAPYHDQILPVVKGIAGYHAINLTAGLPFIRVSVDHGTAFDIAGQGIASAEGLIACFNFCLDLTKNN